MDTQIPLITAPSTYIGSRTITAYALGQVDARRATADPSLGPWELRITAGQLECVAGERDGLVTLFALRDIGCIAVRVVCASK
jgi:hypothetical protein